MLFSSRGFARAALPMVAFLGGLAESSALPLPQYNDLIVRENKVEDDFTPGGGPIRWAALGDSYSAGPGAGEPIKTDYGKRCHQHMDAWPIALDRDFPFQGHNDLHPNFWACTGDKTTDMVFQQIDKLGEHGDRGAKLDFVTLTLGGNDFNFAAIAQACLAQKGNCDGLIDRAMTELTERTTLYQSMQKVWTGIFQYLEDDWHYQVYHLGYPTFFNEETDWCDDQKFKWHKILRGRKLTKELRRKINHAIRTFNEKLKEAIHEFNKHHTEHNVGGSPNWKHKRLFFVDVDDVFEGHRFCEPGVKSLSSSDIWLFDLGGHDHSDSRATIDGDSVMANDAETDTSHLPHINNTSSLEDPTYEDDSDVAGLTDLQDTDTADDISPRGMLETRADFLGLTPSFHPKPIGFEHIANKVAHKLKKKRNPETWGECPRGLTRRASDGKDKCSHPGADWGEKKCNDGSKGPHTYAERDPLMKHAMELCDDKGFLTVKGKGASSKDMGRHTPNWAKFHIANDGAEKKTVEPHTCRKAFRTLIDDCDSSHNPRNIKHGGSITHGKITFKLKPLVYHRPKTTAGDQTCDGLNTRTYIGRDLAKKNSEDFCKEMSQKVHLDKDVTRDIKYNKGKKTVRFSISGNPDKRGKAWVFHERECIFHFAHIIDSCDAQGPELNPKNFKHGGERTSAGLTYAMKLTEKRDSPAPKKMRTTCIREYKFPAPVHYVTIYGSGWGMRYDGDIKGNLEKQLSGCGARTSIDWYTAPDPDHIEAQEDTSNTDDNGKKYHPEWRYDFTLPIAVNDNCVGRAIETAGGPPITCEA